MSSSSSSCSFFLVDVLETISRRIPWRDLTLLWARNFQCCLKQLMCWAAGRSWDKSITRLFFNFIFVLFLLIFKITLRVSFVHVLLRILSDNCDVKRCQQFLNISVFFFYVYTHINDSIFRMYSCFRLTNKHERLIWRVRYYKTLFNCRPWRNNINIHVISHFIL